VLLAACTFEHGIEPDGDDQPRPCMTTPVWWNAAFPARFPLSVSAPPGYTLRVDASAALAAGPDVRVIVHDGTTTRELDRLLDSPAVTFKVPGSGSVWLYAGPGSGTPPTNASNVYLFAESFDAITSGNGDGSPRGSSRSRSSSG
jgi:hypothetical protein